MTKQEFIDATKGFSWEKKRDFCKQHGINFTFAAVFLDDGVLHDEERLP